MALEKILKQLEQTAATISEKAAEYGDAAVAGAKDGARVVSELAQDGREKLRVSYYNPVFPEDYASPTFDLPKMIVVVDEDERKGVDVCEGSIGWLSKDAGLEVLHLYEEAVPISGLHFHPRPACDSVYYADAFDTKRFVSLDCYFDVMQKDKLTELKSIAHLLGAKKCRLESYESAKEVVVARSRAGVNAKIPTSKGLLKGDGSAEADSSSSKNIEKKTLVVQLFEGSAEPVRPELRWYAHDREISYLINTRCTEGGCNSTKNYRLEIDCSSSLTMSKNQATKIEATLGKLGVSCNFSLSGEVMRESRQKLAFEVEF